MHLTKPILNRPRKRVNSSSAMSEVFHGYRLADRGDQDQSVVNAVLKSAQSLISETSPTQGLAPVVGLWARRAHIQ